MKARCQYSGINFSDETNFISSFTTSIHPIFHLHESKLFAISNLITDDERCNSFSDNELRITALALLHNLNNLTKHTFPLFIQSSTIESFKVNERPVVRHLINTIPQITAKLSAFSRDWLEVNIPQFNINFSKSEADHNPTLRFLAAAGWIESISEILVSSETQRAAITALENKKAHYVSSLNKVAKLKGIMSNGTREEKTKAIVSYIKLFASLPVTNILSPFTGKTTTIADYWLTILKADDMTLLGIIDSDIQELEDHLIDNLPVDDFTHYVMAFMRDIKERKAVIAMPFSLVDFALSKDDSANFSILGVDDSMTGVKKVKSIDELLAEAEEKKRAKAMANNTSTIVSPSFDLNSFFASAGTAGNKEGN